VIGSGVAGAVGALLLTVGILAVGIYLLKRIQVGGGNGAKGVALHVLKRVPVGPKQGIALVQVGDRVLVVSIAENGTRLLTELKEKALLEALRPAESERPVRHGHALRLPLLGRIGLLFLLLMPLLARAQETTPAQPAPAIESGAPASSDRQSPSGEPQAAGAVQEAVGRDAAPPAGEATDATNPSTAIPLFERRASRSEPVFQRSSPGFRVESPIAPRVDISIGEGPGALRLSGAVGLVIFIAVLTLLPALFLLMTSFTRILIVLQFLKPALGTQTLPPNQLLVALAVLLTGVVMSPVLQETNRTAIQPFFKGEITQAQAYSTGVKPFREFMLANVREKDLTMFTELSGASEVETVDEIPTVTLVSAFVTSELRTAFQMGFVIFLPFIVVDVIVASVLMSLGMFMLPPMMISLPFKLLLFVLADGWTLVVRNLIASFRG
jgi:flagellar biosynthesis protein FliP